MKPILHLIKIFWPPEGYILTGKRIGDLTEYEFVPITSDDFKEDNRMRTPNPNGWPPHMPE
jgi:hypothetical protein